MCFLATQDSKMLEQPPPMMDPKLQLPQPEYRPAVSTGRGRQRQRSSRRTSSGAGAGANAAAVQGRVNAVGVPAQYMQPVSFLCSTTLLALFWLPIGFCAADKLVI